MYIVRTYRDEAYLNRFVAITNIPSYKVSDQDNEVLCLKAQQHFLAGILVSPGALESTRTRLLRTNVPIGVSISYPGGTGRAQDKKEEIIELTDRGADVLCMGLQMGKLRDGKSEIIQDELCILNKNARGRGTMAMIESTAINHEEMALAIELAVRAGIQWMVAGTGFKENQLPFATKAHVAHLAKCADGRIGVAVLGGVDTRAQAMDMLKAGANLIISEKADQIVM